MGDQRGPESVAPAEENGEIQDFVITKEFLEFTFEKEIESFETKLGTNPGDNYMSVIHSVEIVFKGESKTNYYIIKCYPSHPGRREFLDKMNIFEKELFMYSEYFPALKQIAEDNNANEGLVKLSVPPFHGGNVASDPCKKFKDSKWANDNFVVMTDLRKAGFKMVDRLQGMDLDHAKLVLQNLAKLHSLSWAHKQQHGLKFIADKYPMVKEDMKDDLKEQFTGFMEQLMASTLSMVEEALSKDHPASKACKTFFEGDMIDVMTRFMMPHDVPEDDFENALRVKPEENKNYNKEQWLIQIHGDCWTNNFIFRYDENNKSEKPIEMTFVDFQASKESCCTVDLAYFLHTSVRAPIRVPHKEELLQAYHDTFLESCKKLNVKPFPGFSIDSLKRRYRRSEIFGFVIALPLLSVVLKPVGESIDMDKADKDQSIVDLFSTVMGGSDKNTALKREMVATVLNMYETGVI